MSKRGARSILTLTVNGREREDIVPDGMLLLDYLRERHALTGTKQGCDGGECGACTVLVDGRPRLSCSTLALQVQGRRVETIDGLSRHGRMNDLQALLRRNLDPGLEEIRAALAGNLCRCTGYAKIIESVAVAAAARKATP